MIECRRNGVVLMLAGCVLLLVPSYFLPLTQARKHNLDFASVMCVAVDGCHEEQIGLC